MCVFGAATASILLLVFKSISGYSNAWGKAFLLIGTCLEIAFLYYPYFGCLTSHHRIIGALMGLPYATVYFLLYMTTSFQKCNGLTTSGYVLFIFIEMPPILCHLFIMGKFILVLYNEIKEHGTFKVQFFFHNADDQSEVQEKLARPWLKDYVKDLMKSRPSREYSRIEFYLRKIYNPEKNFKFSTQTLSVVMICSILLYAISLFGLYFASLYLNIVNKAADSLLAKVRRGVAGSFIGAFILAAIFSVFSLIRFMENHKNNMLRMFKGDKSFIPRFMNVSQFMIGKGLRYHSFQIGYFMWGYILLMLLFFVIFFSIFCLSFSIVRGLVASWFEGGGVLFAVAFLTRLSLPVTAMTIFRDHNYSKDVISINNRNVYLVFSYFWFFLGLPMGFFSAMFRILKTMAVGALMLPRIDHSLMPDGFQRLDGGFNAYICYLHVQTAYRNPVLRVFCQILSDETRHNRERKWTYSAQARARWFLALTLARNPQLASNRKLGGFKAGKAPQPDQGGCVEHGDVKIEVGRYGLMQDK
ncbi:Hypothetical predicted protein [Paramuricea clavata]|nr:Hypothetical predicted protein [Paramuricea clavata]